MSEDEKSQNETPEASSAPTTSDPAIGGIEWCDLTVPNADNIQGFYADVVGWKTEPVSMGEYSDFNVNLPGTGDTVAGICHARGVNADLPPQWLIYVRVASVPASVERCLALGGKVVDGPKSMGDSEMCVIQDPAGAVMALYGTKQNGDSA